MPTPALNCYSGNCPTRFVLDRIADKWTVLILGLLVQEPLRFNALLRRIDGMTQKVLAQALKRMERDGLIVRTAFATVPVTVEYTVSSLGQSLAHSMRALIKWSEDNALEVTRSQAEYDVRHEATSEVP